MRFGEINENHHLNEATLEQYSLNDLAWVDLEAVEGHLLICSPCIDRLLAVEPFNTVHYTEDGPFYSRITRLRNGSFRARHWGCQIEGGRLHVDFTSACKYLLESFGQMFPEHECSEACSITIANLEGQVS